MMSFWGILTECRISDAHFRQDGGLETPRVVVRVGEGIGQMRFELEPSSRRPSLVEVRWVMVQHGTTLAELKGTWISKIRGQPGGRAMSKGIFTAVSGAVAQTERLDTIANNLANVNTPGFKRDSQIFKEYVTAYQKEPTAMTIPRIPGSIESFYDMNGGDKSYVETDGTHTDYSQGFAKATGNKLDVAIDGDGFFEVATPQGVRMTRAGSFTINNDGILVTKQGFPVLKEGAPGSDPQGRMIKTDGTRDIAFGEGGEITQGNQPIGKLSLVTVQQKDALQKQGENLYTFRNGYNATPESVKTSGAGTKLQQGFLEGSNVNPIKEMTDMITATRTFESTQKAIQAYDDMQKKLVTDVPKI